MKAYYVFAVLDKTAVSFDKKLWGVIDCTKPGVLQPTVTRTVSMGKKAEVHQAVLEDKAGPDFFGYDILPLTEYRAMVCLLGKDDDDWSDAHFVYHCDGDLPGDFDQNGRIARDTLVEIARSAQRQSKGRCTQFDVAYFEGTSPVIVERWEVEFEKYDRVEGQACGNPAVQLLSESTLTEVKFL